MDKSDSWRLSGASTPVEASAAQSTLLHHAPVVWSDWPLRVDAETWQRDSHDLFDYESRIVQQRGFLVSRHFRVVRIGTKVEVLMDGQYPPPTEEIIDYLLNVRVRDGRYVVAPAERAPTPNSSVVPKKLWLIVKDLPDERHILCEGDVIKLGRFRLRVKQLARQVDGEPPPELRLEDVVSDIPQISEEEARTMQCRICLLDGGTAEDPLICPCNCKGSIKFVHVECLRHWINGKLNFTDKRVFFFRQLPCELCKSPFPCAVRFPSGEKINIVDVPLTETPFIVLENFGGGQGLTKGMHVFSMAGKDELKLGRGHESDVRIPDVSISRYHATIRYNFTDNAFTLDDHKSKFGTLVSMRKNQALDCGDKFSVQVGRTVLKLTVDSSVRPSSEVVVLDDMKSETNDSLQPQPPPPNNGNNGSSNGNSSSNNIDNSSSNNIANTVVGGGGSVANNDCFISRSQINNALLPFDCPLSGSTASNEGIKSGSTGIPLNSSTLMSGFREPLGLVSHVGSDKGRNARLCGYRGAGSGTAGASTVAMGSTGGLFLSNLLYGGVPVAAANSNRSSNPTTATNNSDSSCVGPLQNGGGYSSQLSSLGPVNADSSVATNGNSMQINTVGNGGGSNFQANGNASTADHSNKFDSSEQYCYNTATSTAAANSAATAAAVNTTVALAAAVANLDSSSSMGGASASSPSQFAFTPASVAAAESNSQNLFGFGVQHPAVDMRTSSIQSDSIRLGHPTGGSSNSSSGPTIRGSSKASVYLNSLLRMSRPSSENVPTAANVRVGCGDTTSNVVGSRGGSSSGSSGGALDSVSAQGDTFATSPLACGMSASNSSDFSSQNNSSSSRINPTTAPFMYMPHPSPWLDSGSSINSTSPAHSSSNANHHQQSNPLVASTAGGANPKNNGNSNSLLEVNSGLPSQASTAQSSTCPPSSNSQAASQASPPLSSSPPSQGMTTAAATVGGRFGGLRGDGSVHSIEHLGNSMGAVNFGIIGSERSSNSAAAGLRDQSRIAGEFVLLP